MADRSGKTEKATPKRRRDERKKGHVFMSQDAVAVVTIVGAWSIFFLWCGRMAQELISLMALCIQRTATSAELETALSGLFTESILAVVKSAGPLLLVTGVCAIVATMFQTRMLVSQELIKPKLSKINPISGFKNLFSLNKLVDTFKNVLKIIVLITLIYQSIRDSVLESSKYLYTDIQAAGAHILSNGRALLIKIIIAFVVLAFADFLYQRWKFERDMMMTKQEVKDEYKQLEGDPKVKGRIREIQRQRAQSRMMQQVPQADVVIRNPTHFAVALRYKPERDNAPVVLAKGQDELALRIVKVAEEAGVTVMENVELARALYAQAELDREIPPSLYEAVAEVLVYIFRLNENKQIVK